MRIVLGEHCEAGSVEGDVMKSKREFGAEFWEIFGSMPDFRRLKGKKSKRSLRFGKPSPGTTKPSSRRQLGADSRPR